MSQYLEVVFKYNPAVTDGEILLAILAEMGFDSFREDESVLIGYIEKDKLDIDAINNFGPVSRGEVIFEQGELEDVNWNEEWEKNYEPVNIEDRCYLRADFHPVRNDFEYEVVITPKMSFGTGHHDTTYLMIKHMLDMDFSGKTVFDIGTGTGVLAIFAAMKGAYRVLAIDNSPWSVGNTRENAERNKIQLEIDVRESEIQNIEPLKFDILLANINRNVILEDLGRYKASMKPNSKLLLSGIMEHDEHIIRDRAQSFGLELILTDKRGQWIFLEYQ